MVDLPSPSGVGVILRSGTEGLVTTPSNPLTSSAPRNHDVSSILAMRQTVDDAELHFGFVFSVQLKLIRMDADLRCEFRDWLWGLSHGDLDIAVREQRVKKLPPKLSINLTDLGTFSRMLSGSGRTFLSRAAVQSLSALWKVLCMRRATVMGPTPPGTGVICEATFEAEAKSTSPTRRWPDFFVLSKLPVSLDCTFRSDARRPTWNIIGSNIYHNGSRFDP